MSVAPLGSAALGVRTEVKNVNGLRFLARAVGAWAIMTPSQLLLPACILIDQHRRLRD